ncbi:MAG: alpha/beta fold hydrolase [bacterium]|nr:alpha/beta fold hydrolase [bacterium]
MIWYSEVSFWGYVPVQGFQEKPTGYEPALRLEGPDAPAKTPVLIIPGIAGSELKNGDDLIWADLGQMFLDINDEFLTENLGLDEDGQSINIGIQTGEAIEKVLGGVPVVNINIFEGLRLRLIDSGYSLNQDLFYFPYDWRLDLNGTASLLADKIEEIKSQTGAEKINIVAHSMGGLLAKEYVRQNNKDSIDKLIFVGTPHLGAPKAGKIILAGDRMGIPWLEEDRIEEIGQHSIAAHELLPDQSYFSAAGPYIKQTEALLDYSQTKQLLLNEGSSPNVFTAAENFLNNNLENLDFSGVNVYNIAGCAGGTQGGYEVRADGSIAFTKYRAGDQTVPLVSGDGISVPAENKFYSTEGSHAELPSRPGVRNLIADILDNQPLTSYENLSIDKSTCGIEG